MTGRQVHVSTNANAINAFMDSDKSKMICFRCGETGHVRFQCLTYKVRMCWHGDQSACSITNCPFAHHVSELRQPWKQRCVRVIKQNGSLICIGCGSEEHTFRKCPLHRDTIV